MSDGHITHEKNTYKVTFHPAFASRCAVKNDEGECVVYVQDQPHKLNGQKHPKKHRIKLSGGALKRDVTLEIDDPNHAIARISVDLYAAGNVPGMGAGTRTTESFEFLNDAKTCPPICGDNEPI